MQVKETKSSLQAIHVLGPTLFHGPMKVSVHCPSLVAEAWSVRADRVQMSQCQNSSNEEKGKKIIR